MRLEGYRFGRIVVDGEPCHRDLLVTPDGERLEWRRREGHRLCPEDLKAVWRARPEVLVVGTGAFGRMRVQEAVHERAAAHGIRLEVFRTAEAVACFERLRSEGRRVAAALHLTC